MNNFIVVSNSILKIRMLNSLGRCNDEDEEDEKKSFKSVNISSISGPNSSKK